MDPWIKKGFLIMLVILGLVAPMGFAWMTEIIFDPIPNMELTNGFYNADPMIIYHLALYLNVATSVLLAGYVMLINWREP